MFLQFTTTAQKIRRILQGFIGVLFFVLPMWAASAVIPKFVGGIDYPAARTCMLYLKQKPCQLNKMLSGYQLCVKKNLFQHMECQQARTFFKLTNGGVFHELRRYPGVDVILADYVYIADQGQGYFLIMRNGMLLTLPLNVNKKQLQPIDNYLTWVKKFPRMQLWQITGFPKFLHVSPDRTRLVFTQQIKDGCNACKILGNAVIAYDFSKDGKNFYGIKVLKLIPTTAVRSVLISRDSRGARAGE